MADVGVEYVLTAPGPVAITFNDGVDPFDGTDKYYITEIRGLESPAIRTPFDPVPLGDGALIHPFYYGATHIAFEGVIIVNSVSVENDIVVIRNTMTEDLKNALNGIKDADGTLAFTPQGLSAQLINGLRYEIGLNLSHTDNYHTVQFSFGIVTGTPYA